MPEPAAGPSRIVLVGFMGAGKSTVGPLLARRLGWSFLDMDPWIEARTGLSVPRLFAERGEAAFRNEERQAALHVRELERHVVAAGGGAFAMPDTRDILRAGAATVWLRCDLETALARIERDSNRPLASNRETIRRLFSEREPSYRQADLTVDSNTAGPEQVAEGIRVALFEAPSDDAERRKQ